MTRAALIAELTRVQNDSRNWHRDILTITGFMSVEEVARHLQSEKARLSPINVNA